MDYAGPCATAVAGILSCRANQVLETSGGHVAADLTKHVVGGAVRQLLSSIASLYPHRVPGQAKDSVDVMSPCLEEKSLAVATVAKLQQHVSQLLERYPEQPLLDQLQKICKRILGVIPLNCMQTTSHGTCACQAPVELGDDETTADFLLMSVRILSSLIHPDSSTAIACLSL